MTSHLTGALAAIIADPDCCAASKDIARDALAGVPFNEQPVSAKVAEALRWALAELNGKTRYDNGEQYESCLLDAEAALSEMVATAQAAGDYSGKAHNPLVSDFWRKAHFEAKAMQMSEDEDVRAAGYALGADIELHDHMTKPVMSEDVRRIVRGLLKYCNPIGAVGDDFVAKATALFERPVEPEGNKRLWYRGWECAYDDIAGQWIGDGYYACLGGEDLDCIVVRASTWSDLLDEIDDHDKTEKTA